MSSKTFLVLFGLLVIVAIAAAMSEEEELRELSEEIESSRVARGANADPDAKRNKNKEAQKKLKNKGKGRNKDRKKARKNNKKNKSKRNKNKKGKRKQQGKAKKRQGNKKKSRKNQKPRKNNRGRTGNKFGRTTDTSTANSTCFENAVFYMKLWKDVVTNFEKQKARMEKQNSTGGNKAGKKGVFAPIAFKLVDIGGGNKTNMSCGGSYGNTGAKQLQNLTKTLFDCELSVNKSCNPANFPQPNTTFISNCEKLVTQFKFSVQVCLNKTLGTTKTNVSDACGCWIGPQLAATALATKSCKASDEAKKISQQFNKCKAAFSVCRKYEDAAIPSIAACSQSSTALTKKAATLSANSASLTSVKTKAAALAGSSSGKRVVRAVATTCAEIVSKTKARKCKPFILRCAHF